MDKSGLLLVVGLGNPGGKYSGTRHNIGFEVVDSLAGVGAAWRSRHGADVTEVRISGRKIVVIKPLTFMNCSGEPLGHIMRFHKFHPHQIIVVHDELDLPLGAVKFKFKGGEGGHNGLRSISSHLKSKEYYRCRVGIGKPVNKAQEVSSWVLSRFRREEEAVINESIERACRMIEFAVERGVGEAMQEFH